jgi:hypothetical protein
MATPSKPPPVKPQAPSETATLPPSVPDDAVTLPPPPAPSDTATLAPTGSAVAAGMAVAVPGYEIERELGRGGMGVVYQARQMKLNRLVALKMILAGGHAGAADLARFQTEAEAIARLRHPNIVQVYEVGEHEGKPFFSLEFCGGGSLEKKLGGTPLPPKEAASLVETLARAMQAAHEQKVIHRDLKPANVLLAEDGTPKITDFGLAKKLDEAGQTQSGAIMGTPSYMAPEQAGGKSTEVGPLCDVYALGAILYECLTGRPPFKAATALDTIMQLVSDEPVPPMQLQPKTPRDVETICLKCLQKEPARRYESATALADDLRRYLEGDAVSARPLGEWESAVRWARKHPVTAVLTVLTATGMLLWTVVLVTTFVVMSDGSTQAILSASALATGQAGFLAAMAILVRPRRRLALGGLLLVLLVGGFPWGVRASLGRSSADHATEEPNPTIRKVLIVPLALTVGVALAGLLGGMSRWLARRYQGDMLTVFFGGGFGAVAAMMLCACCAMIPLMITNMSGRTSAVSMVSFLVAYQAITLIGGLFGFCAGGTLVARFTQRRRHAG